MEIFHLTKNGNLFKILTGIRNYYGFQLIYMDNDILLQLYKASSTVFTVNEIAQLIPNINYESLQDRLYYFAKTGKIKRLNRGIYAKEMYDPYEAANKMYRPSYISLETVLSKAGAVFQHYERIFAVSYVTRSITVDKSEIQYRRLKKEILVNMKGIEQKNNYFIANVERAFLDSIYLYKNYYFDNLGVINWENAISLSEIYKSKSLEKRLKGYHKLYLEEYGKS